jgi:hypothetical protein
VRDVCAINQIVMKQMAAGMRAQLFSRDLLLDLLGHILLRELLDGVNKVLSGLVVTPVPFAEAFHPI